MQRKEFGEIVRFAITGLAVNGTDLGLYSLLIHFIPKPIAKAFSFTCGGIVAYLLNKYWTFRQEQKSSSEITRFIVANGSALVLNVSVNQLILYLNPDAVITAVVTATIVTSVYTYIVFKFWVFRHLLGRAF